MKEKIISSLVFVLNDEKVIFDDTDKVCMCRLRHRKESQRKEYEAFINCLRKS